MTTTTTMMKPKRMIYAQRCAFRTSPALSEKLWCLADRVNRHPSDLMRQALADFVTRYETRPQELERLT